jgi:predicted O-linked N-acetylglucosamine transferase (SPINDLY family)
MALDIAASPGACSFDGLPLERLLLAIEHEAAPAAIAGYRAWLAANPRSPQSFAAWFNLGVLLSGSGRRAEAILAYREALGLKPDLYQASINLGLALEAEGQRDAALAAWAGALQPASARTALLNQQGRLLESAKRYAEAEQALHASLLTDPKQPDVIQHWSHIRQKGCLWPLHPPGGLPGLAPEEIALHAGPLGALALTDDVALQRSIGEAWIARKVPPAPERLAPPGGYPRRQRIRVGYLSSDFCRHAMGFLIVDLLERHDRARFEVFGYCSTAEDGSEIRQRILGALDHHVPVRALSEEALARRIRADEIDILVDLNGLTLGARLEALRWKPAPVQATYLGYVGPVPLPELDWLICDDTVVPPDQARHYAPRPLPLAGLYQANDSRMAALPTMSRAQEGLPDDAFVLCCFNNFYKITEEVFAAWTAILRQLDHAVLWLAEDNATGTESLRRRLAMQGLEPGRLILAPRADPARYLARFVLADLFLDTFPYNAGTVASDALRMGLPLVTRPGRSFASRMATSLLQATGVTETIAATPEDYVAIAVALGTDPARHARLRAVLSNGAAWRRVIGDGAAFAARMEAAYESILVTAG